MFEIKQGLFGLAFMGVTRGMPVKLLFEQPNKMLGVDFSIGLSGSCIVLKPIILLFFFMERFKCFELR